MLHQPALLRHCQLQRLLTTALTSDMSHAPFWHCNPTQPSHYQPQKQSRACHNILYLALSPSCLLP